MTTTTGTNAFPSRRAALAYYKTAAGDPTCTLKDIDRKIAEGAIRIHAPKLGDCVIVNGERRWLYIVVALSSRAPRVPRSKRGARTTGPQVATTSTDGARNEPPCKAPTN
jgi:hypothetical protein